MKVYLSADIEGVAGITAPDEANPEHRVSVYFADQMTREVAAACQGAIAAGVQDILVKDAHWTGRNIDPRRLPECVRVVRGWTGHPFGMLDQLDSSFDALLYVGYHARAGSGGNPLAHTLSSRLVAGVRLNDSWASEFLLNTYTAWMLGVPVAFLSGDAALCEEVRAFDERIVTYATLVGVGAGTVSVHPDVATRRIQELVQEALKQDRAWDRPLPSRFKLEVTYKTARDAYARSFYPGAALVGDDTVRFESRDYFDILRMIAFCI